MAAVVALIVKMLLLGGVVALWPPAAASEPPGTWVIDRAWRGSAASAGPAVEVAWPDHPPAADTIYTAYFRIEAPPAGPGDRPRALRLGPGCGDFTLRLDGQLLWRASPSAQAAPSVSSHASRCLPARVIALPPDWLRPGSHALSLHVDGPADRAALPLPTLALGWHDALDDAERRRAAWAAAPAAAGTALLLLAGAVGLGMAWRWRRVTGAPRSTPHGAPHGAPTSAPATPTALPDATLHGATLHSATLPGAALPAGTLPSGPPASAPSNAAALAALGGAALFGAGLALAPLIAPAAPTGTLAAAMMLAALAMALAAAFWGLRRGLWTFLPGLDRGLAALSALSALAWIGGRASEASASAPAAAWPDAALLACATALAALLVRVAVNLQRARQDALKAQAWLDQRIRDATAEIERNFRQLAELRVEQVTERERKRIAGDLHDDLGAKLLTIVHTSESERISTLAREALEEMRLSVRGLTGRPVLLHDALGDWRVEVVSRLSQAGIECGWSAPDDPESSPRLSSRAYVQTTRILRESTSNIIKHSGASRVEVRCAVADGDFQLVIQDNGNGISADLEHRIDRGHGLASMKSRAKQLQGQCLVESAPGYGTVIRLTIPMDRATEGRQTPG